MAEILKSKTSGKIWTSPKSFYDEYVKDDPAASKLSPEDLWKHAIADKDGYQQISNTEMATKSPGSYLKETVSNVPGSLGRWGANTALGLIQTIPAVVSYPFTRYGHYGEDAMSALDLVKDTAGTIVGHKPSINRFIQRTPFGEGGKYSSVENTLGTLREDPVGVLSDGSTVIGGAGVLTKAASIVPKVVGATKASNMLNAGSKAMQRGAALTNPMSLTLAGPRKVASMIPAVESRIQRAAENIYISGIGKTNQVEKAEDLRPGVKRMLSEKVPLNAEGLAKNKKLAAQHESNRSAMTAKAGNNQYDIDPVHQKVQDFAVKSPGKTSGLMLEDANRIIKEEQDALLRQHPTGAPTLTPAQMHEKLKGANAEAEPFYAADRKGERTPITQTKKLLSEAKADGFRESTQTSLNKFERGLGDAFAKEGLAEKDVITMQNEMRRIVRNEEAGAFRSQYPSETTAQINTVTGSGGIMSLIVTAKSVLKNPEMMSKMAINLANQGIPVSRTRAFFNVMASIANQDNKPESTQAPPIPKSISSGPNPF